MLLAKVTGADRLLGSIGVAEEAQAQASSCVLIPAKTEGPYFVDEKLNRSDIRTDPATGATSPGIPVALRMVVVRADASCAPVQGAVVDIWHADATGKYSDIASEGTSGKRYLRGLQATDANGCWFTCGRASDAVTDDLRCDAVRSGLVRQRVRHDRPGLRRGCRCGRGSDLAAGRRDRRAGSHH